MFSDDPVDVKPKIYGLTIGEVVSNNDPENLGRVKVFIPGIAEPTPWALPLGRPTAPSEGVWWVPKVGAEVGVFFRQGDIDYPHYMAGHWGRGEVPSEVTGVDDKAIVTPEYIVTISSGALKVEHRLTGDAIEHTGLTGQWKVKGTAGIVLESLGEVRITATAITLNGRPVLPASQPI